MTKKTFFLALFILITLPLAVRGAENEQNINANVKINQGSGLQARSNLLQKNQERNQNWLENRCKNMETRIDTRINRYENNKNRHITVYTNLKNRLEKLVARLKAKGLDTSKLESDLATLGDKIKKLSSDMDAFISSLKDTKNFTCGSSEGEFKNKLGEARTSRTPVYQNVLDIRNYFQKTIRPDIQELRKKLSESTNNNQTNVSL